MTLVWDYDMDLFGEDVARLLSGRFLHLLRAYLESPETPLADLDPTVVEPAAEPVPVPADRDPLDPVAGRHPSQPALLCGARRLTYGELDEHVGALAERLRTAGVTPGRPVAVVLPRGTDSLIALLACLRTGAVYCPLSPSDPPARLGLLLEQLAPALVLTGDGTPALPEGLPTARIDAPVLPPAHGTTELPGTAYVIHTSGSTGTPKPVAVGHAALVHHLTATADRFGLTTSDRVLMFAQPSFDVALEEVLPALYAGACLVLPEYEVPTGAELAEALVSARVTVANLPTSYFLATREDLRPVLRDESWAPRLVVLGGERLPVEALRGVLADTDATVLNVYGVTEAAISSTVHEVSRDALAEGAEIPWAPSSRASGSTSSTPTTAHCRPARSANSPSPAPVSPRATRATRRRRPPGSSPSTRPADSASTSPATSDTAASTACSTSSGAATTRSSCAATASSWRRSRRPRPRYWAAAPAPSYWTGRAPAGPGSSASSKPGPTTRTSTRRRCTPS